MDENKKSNIYISCELLGFLFPRDTGYTTTSDKVCPLLARRVGVTVCGRSMASGSDKKVCESGERVCGSGGPMADPWPLIKSVCGQVLVCIADLTYPV